MLIPEGLGMDHPLVMARLQAGMDGVLLASQGVPLDEAIRRTVPRIKEIFGEYISRELIEVAVTVGYCSRPEAPIPRRYEDRGLE
jgi:hypothetical protein